MSLDAGADRVEACAQAGLRDLVKLDAGGRGGCAADVEGLEADGVVALLDPADLDVHEVTGFEGAMGRCAVDECGAGAGGELGRDRRVVGSGAAHRVLDLRREPAFADAGPGVFERGLQTGLRESASAAKERELVLGFDEPRVGEQRGAVDATRGRECGDQHTAERVRHGAGGRVEANDLRIGAQASSAARNASAGSSTPKRYA
jgi:hypothetical protein